MKKLITPLLLLALTLAAAPPVNISTFTVNCSSLATTVCDTPTVTAYPLDPNVSYEIDGFGPVTPLGQDTATWFPPTGSALNAWPTGDSTLANGGWTFEIHALGNNGTEKNKVLATFSATLPN